ncbi:MAG: hypothetical protein KF835_03165 [Xanthobacteraceae bacterium]|nr:hypothetical protein [Xanthobacteraceae bacterium]
MKTTKIWLGVGVAIVAGASSAAQAENLDPLNSTSINAPAAHSFVLAQLIRGEGGENESGESGEGGIDAAAADKDPVKYGIALQVIAAHYYAGLAAYEAGEKTAGTQMFAHGFSEVYAEMEEVFKKRGVKDLGAKIEAAIAAANKNAPAPEVRKAVEAVQTALAGAEKAGPKSALSALAVKAQVIADMLDRAAAQYVLTLKKDSTLETYLDGLGFALAARTEAEKILSELEKSSAAAAKAIRAALDLASNAYPGLKRGAPADTAKFLAAASTARIAATNLR